MLVETTEVWGSNIFYFLSPSTSLILAQQRCSEINDGVDAIDDLPCPGVRRKLRRYNSISHQLGTSDYRANHRSSDRQTRFRDYSGTCHAGSKESFQTTLYGVKADLSARVHGASTRCSNTGDPSPICSWQLRLNICHMSNAMKCF